MIPKDKAVCMDVFAVRKALHERNLGVTEASIKSGNSGSWLCSGMKNVWNDIDKLKRLGHALRVDYNTLIDWKLTEQVKKMEYWDRVDRIRKKKAVYNAQWAEYLEAEEAKEKARKCSKCYYHKNLAWQSANSEMACHYLYYTGKMRTTPPWECDCFKPRRRGRTASNSYRYTRGVNEY